MEEQAGLLLPQIFGTYKEMQRASVENRQSPVYVIIGIFQGPLSDIKSASTFIPPG